MPRTKEVFQQIRDESRQKILEKAAEVFAKKGLADTKVSDLARAANVSHGLLYWYFTDKDDVFMAVLERAANGLTGYVQQAAAYEGTPLEKFRWLTEQILHGMSEDPLFLQLISQAMALSGRVHEVVAKFETIGSTLREIVKEGQNSGEIVKRDPDQLLLLYFSCLYGLAAGKSFNIRGIDRYFPPAETVLQVFKP